MAEQKPGPVAPGLSIRLPNQGSKAKFSAPVNQHLRLTAAEMAAIATLPNSPLYQVILRVMEGELTKLETAHMQKWGDRESFDRSGLIAVAARIFFESVQKEINYQTEEYLGIQLEQEAKQEELATTPEQFMRRSLGLEQ